MSAFDKIIGFELIKEELRQLADCLKNTNKYRMRGVSIPRGLLLEGDPGVGKTSMTMCLVAESGRKAFTCRKDTHDGDFVEHIREIFEQAEENAPSIVVLDDMDKFANAEGRNCYAEEYVTVQSCIDMIKGKDIFVIATANDTSRVPVSLIRHGRFDVKLKIERPDYADTERIISHYLSNKPGVNADARIVAEILSGRTSATLETVINEAGLIACYEGSDTITTEHMIKAILRAVYTVTIPSDTSTLPDIDLHQHSFASEVVYHEAGHAAMSEIIKPNSVALVAAFGECSEGGFIKRIKDGRDRLMEEHEQSILISLAGKAAVELKYGIPGFGGISDFSNVYDSLWSWADREAVYGFDLHTGRREIPGVTEHIQQQVITHRMAEYYQQAKKLLIENRSLLDGIAEELAEKRYLISNDIQKIKSAEVK